VIAFLISRGGALPSKPCTLIYTALGAHCNTSTTVYTHPTFLLRIDRHRRLSSSRRRGRGGRSWASRIWRRCSARVFPLSLFSLSCGTHAEGIRRGGGFAACTLSRSAICCCVLFLSFFPICYRICVALSFVVVHCRHS
jgi:hypothetical protein